MDRTAQSEQSLKEYTRHDLVKLTGHPYWFYCPLNDLKTYRKGDTKISTGLTSIKEAKRLVENELKKRCGLDPDMARRIGSGVTNPLVRDCWDALMRDRRPKRSKGTYIKYDLSWRTAIEPFWGNLTAAQVNQPSQSEFESWYMENRPTKQFFNVGKHLKMLFKYMHMHGYISRQPVMENLDKRINKITQRKKVGRVYSPDEQAALLRATSTPYARYTGREARIWPWQYKARVGILLGLQAGLRKMEAVSLLRSKLDLDKGTIEVWSSKNGYWRKVPIGPTLVQAIRHLIEHSPDSEYLFPMASDPKRHLTSQVFDKAWIRAKGNAGIKGARLESRFHDLRHTFASLTSKRKWSAVAACKVLDMSLKEYLRRYVHTSETDIEAEMRALWGGK